MENMMNRPESEQMQAEVASADPTIEVVQANENTPEAAATVEVVVTATPTPAQAPTQAPTQAPATEPPVTTVEVEVTVAPASTAEATVTAAVSQETSTSTTVEKKEDASMSPFLLGGIILLIVAVIAALTAVLLKARNGRKKPVHKQAQADDEPATQPCGPAVYSGPVISAGMAQTIGARKNQQDSLYCSDWKNPEALVTRGLLAAVADGIGGLSDGNLASGAAMKGMRARFLGGGSLGSMSDRLLELAATAQQEVLAVNASRTARSGSTLVTVLIQDGHMVFLSIGDSRICLYRSGALLQLNREHVLGRINREKQAFGHAVDGSKKPEALTAYLGQEGLQLIDRSLSPMRLVPGDKIVLMSDGVFGTISDAELINCLRHEPQQAADAIIDAVEQHQKPHQDNATVLVVGIG